MAHIKLVGLTGGIGAGKSLVATLLRNEGVLVIDLDELGRTITAASPEVWKRIEGIFGPGVLKEGKPDRGLIREATFVSPEKRQKLENLLQPLIWKAFEAEVEKAVTQGFELVVCEAALLVECNLAQHFDELLVVTAPPEVRKYRVIARDHISEELAQKIIDTQSDDSTRLKRATAHIINDGHQDHVEKQVRVLVNGWRRRGLV